MFVFHANANHAKFKLCKDCAHFDPKSETCKAFRMVSFINGQVSIPQAELLRRSTEFCGIGAKYYKELEVTQFKKDMGDILNKPNLPWK